MPLGSPTHRIIFHRARTEPYTGPSSRLALKSRLIQQSGRGRVVEHNKNSPLRSTFSVSAEMEMRFVHSTFVRTYFQYRRTARCPWGQVSRTFMYPAPRSGIQYDPIQNKLKGKSQDACSSHQSLRNNQFHPRLLDLWIHKGLTLLVVVCLLPSRVVSLKHNDIGAFRRAV